MNIYNILNEVSEEKFWRELVKKKWLRKSILSAFIVASVLYGTNNIRADEKNKQRDLKEASYPELGLTISVINLGYWHKRTGLRLSHYYFNETRNERLCNLFSVKLDYRVFFKFVFDVAQIYFPDHPFLMDFLKDSGHKT